MIYSCQDCCIYLLPILFPSTYLATPPMPLRELLVCGTDYIIHIHQLAVKLKVAAVNVVDQQVGRFWQRGHS